VVALGYRVDDAARGLPAVYRYLHREPAMVAMDVLA